METKKKESRQPPRADRSDKTIVITITVPSSAAISISTDKVSAERASKIELGEEF